MKSIQELMKEHLAIELAMVKAGISPLEKDPMVDNCGGCGELVHNDDFTEFKIGRRYVFLCPKCTQNRREEEPRSEIL